MPTPPADTEPPAPPAGPARAAEQPGELVVASHEALFEPAGPPRCDACGAPLEADTDDGYRVCGQGVYLWARGDQVRFERVPLCPSCASAIGMTALARWEIEEEEG
jgi:hypothetical protein